MYIFVTLSWRMSDQISLLPSTPPSTLCFLLSLSLGLSVYLSIYSTCLCVYFSPSLFYTADCLFLPLYLPIYISPHIYYPTALMKRSTLSYNTLLSVKYVYNFFLPNPFPLFKPSVTARQCVHPCTINGLDIPEGLLIHANLWDVQYDPKHWGDNPEEFDPLRWGGSYHSLKTMLYNVIRPL